MLLLKEKGRPASYEADPTEPTTVSVYGPSDLADWYMHGVKDERERAAGALHELNTSWTRSGAQVARSRYDEMMALYLECAHRFHERELGKPYVEFKGRAA